MATFELNIVTPEKTVYFGPVNSLQAFGSEGSFGVLAGHVPLLTALQTGALSFVEAGGDARHAAVSGGFVEVQRREVIVLAETAELAEEIDVVRARAARDRALERLQRQEDFDYARAQASLARALNRLKLAGIE